MSPHQPIPSLQPVIGATGATRQTAEAERPLSDPERGHKPPDPRAAVPALRDQLDAIIAASPVPEHDDHALIVAARAALGPEV